MGFFDRTKEGGLMDVIRCDEQEYLVWKWRPSGGVNSTVKENSIRFGSSLRVKDGELAVFVYKQGDGTLMDYIVGPHDSIIKTANFPVLTSIVGSLWGGESPFQAEIYFINLQGNNQIRFAVPYFDVVDSRFPDFALPVAVRGTITFNLTDYKQFIKLNRLVDFDLEHFSQQLRDTVANYTKSFVLNSLGEGNTSILQIERRIEELRQTLASTLTTIIENDFGVNLKRLDIASIEIDKESENYSDYVRLTKEQQMRRAEIDTEQYERVAKLSAESQYIQAHAINQQTEVLKTAAESLGQMGEMNLGGGDGFNPAGMMMGMAMGGVMGNQMAGVMNNLGQASQGVSVPPPLPGATQYYVALNNQQCGPYGIQQLQLMAQAGQINIDTLVWTQGLTEWVSIGSVPQLASLFQSTPPPLPR